MNLKVFTRQSAPKNDLELQRLDSSASTRTLVNAAPSIASQSDVLETGVQNAGSSTKKRLLVATGAALAAGTLGAGLAVGLIHIPTGGLSDAQCNNLNALYCQSLENFTWVVPNSPKTNFSSFYDNFHNQPQNLTQPCMDLFNKNKMLANPQPNSIQLNFGPFPMYGRNPSFPVIAKKDNETTLFQQPISAGFCY